MIKIEGKYNKAKIFANKIDDVSANQIQELLNQEFTKDSKIRIMPDVHSGKGCVIGLSMTIKDKICPNLVGVDIGCGMYTCSLGNIDIDLEKLDKFINDNIPNGFNVRNENELYSALSEITKGIIDKLYCKKHLKNIDRLLLSAGTLGGGNHFIEIDKDSDDNKYLIIHSGSRNLGKQVAEYYQNLATSKYDIDFYKKKKQDIIDQCKAEGKEKEISQKLQELKELEIKNKPANKELCYLEGEEMEAYIHDTFICQDFAKLNREIIADTIIKSLFNKYSQISAFHTIHNYISHDNILRKGCINAEKFKTVLIPLNMRDGCILGIGKGNKDYNCTAPHGAGRIMSRRSAKENVSMHEFNESMKGIYSTSVCENTIDESPMVYKDKSDIIKNIHDTVDIIDIIKPIYNFKAK